MDKELENIVATLQAKSALKQQITEATGTIFQHLKTLAAAIAKAMGEYFAGVDKTVIVRFEEVGENEFHLQLGEDMLLYHMYTEVQTFGPEHLISKSAYVQEDPRRGFFGAIMVHNFLADSVRYNRIEDAGYLVARMMLNAEGHYYIEGVRQLNFLHPDIATNVVTEELLRSFLQGTMALAIETDLVAPAYQDILLVALGDKLADKLQGAAKVGFKIASGAGEGK